MMLLWRKRYQPDCMVVGLGNPGPAYAFTRHNLGFMAVEALAKLLGAGRWQHRWSSETAACSVIAERLASVLEELKRQHPAAPVEPLLKAVPNGRVRDARLLLAKPQTFMNLSGRAVAQVVNANRGVGLVVVCDDVNLPWGKLRLRARGGAGGHKGLASIISELGGYQDFPRVRIGVGGGELAEVSEYVLAPLTEQERSQALRLAATAAVKVLEIACAGYEFAASAGFAEQQED